MIGGDEQQELQALRAAAEWLNSAGWPGLFSALSAGQRAVHLCREYGVSRRMLDLAINAVKDGLAYPSQEFLDSREMAARLLGRELTLLELRGIVQEIQKTMET